MRYLHLIFVLLGFTISVSAQPETGTFAQAQAEGVSFSKLDSLYPSAAHANPAKGIFNQKQKEFLSQYRKMMQEFGNFLRDHNFQWGEQTTFFQRIYFDSNGTIDYYFVNFDNSNLSKEQKEHFKKLLQDFSGNYQFPMQADSKFAQCAPITFVDPSKSDQK